MLRYDEYGALPAFANTKNKQLDLQVRSKEKQLSQLLIQLEDQTSRSEALSQHMKNVRHQLAQCQTLYEAKMREQQTESHLKEVAERELGRITSDLKKFSKDAVELMSRSTATQNTIYRVSEKIAKLKSTLKCDTKETEDWLKVQQEKEEDNLILLKYTKEDDQRLRDLASQIEKLVKQIHDKKTKLSHDLTEAQVSRMEVLRAADEFRKLHKERKELLQQWEQTILTTQKKDQEINKQQEHYQNLKMETISMRKSIDEKQVLVDKENEKKEEIEKNINLMDRQIGKLKMEHIEANQALTAFQDELSALKTHLARTANDVTSKQQDLQNLKQEVEEKKQHLKEEEERYFELQKTIKSMLHDTTTKEEKAAHLADYLRQQETRHKELEKKIKQLKEQGFKYSQALFKLRQEEKTLASEISGANTAIRNLTSKLTQLDQASIQQRTLLYHQEYTLQQVERKLKRAQGERTDEEKEQLNAKIQELNEKFEQAQQTYQLVSTQLKKSHDDVRHAKRNYNVLEKEKKRLEEQLDELQLYSTSAQHQLQLKIKEKEEWMVEESVLKLELTKLRGFLNARADEVLGLESRQVQLTLALEERSKEIEIHQSMLKGQIRACEEEKLEYTQEVRDKRAQVDRMKIRYDLWMSQLGSPSEESGDASSSSSGKEEHTQAFYIIKAAQQREALQRQGDQLDQEIQKAEKEIKALENTLKLLNHRNENFKSNLNQLDVLPEDVEHQQHLQLQLQTAQEKLKEKQQTLLRLQQELMNLETHLAQLGQVEIQHQQSVTQLEQQIQVFGKQVQDQQSKKKRMEQTLLRIIKEYRRMKSGSINVVTIEEEDVKQKQVKEMLRLIMHRVEEILSRKLTLDAMEKLHRLYLDFGLQPPSRPLTQLSNRSHSSTSTSSTTSLTSHSRSQGGGSRSTSRASTIRMDAQAIMNTSSSSSSNGIPGMKSTISWASPNPLIEKSGKSTNLPTHFKRSLDGTSQLNSGPTPHTLTIQLDPISSSSSPLSKPLMETSSSLPLRKNSPKIPFTTPTSTSSISPSGMNQSVLGMDFNLSPSSNILPSLSTSSFASYGNVKSAHLVGSRPSSSKPTSSLSSSKSGMGDGGSRPTGSHGV